METLKLITALLIVLTSFGMILSTIMYLMCVVIRDSKKDTKFLADMIHYRDKTFIKTVMLFLITLTLHILIS
jgi:hypothetical protein